MFSSVSMGLNVAINEPIIKTVVKGKHDPSCTETINTHAHAHTSTEADINEHWYVLLWDYFIWKRLVTFSHLFIQDLLYTEKELFHFSVITDVRTYASLACTTLLSCPSTSKSPLEFELQSLPLTQTQIMENKLLIKLCNCHPGLLSWGCYKPDRTHSSVGIYAWQLWSRWHVRRHLVLGSRAVFQLLLNSLQIVT